MTESTTDNNDKRRPSDDADMDAEISELLDGESEQPPHPTTEVRGEEDWDEDRALEDTLTGADQTMPPEAAEGAWPHSEHTGSMGMPVPASTPAVSVGYAIDGMGLDPETQRMALRHLFILCMLAFGMGCCCVIIGVILTILGLSSPSFTFRVAGVDFSGAAPGVVLFVVGPVLVRSALHHYRLRGQRTANSK